MNKRRWTGWARWALALCLLFSSALMAAEGARPGIGFNHDQTTFPLTGIHTNTACESCHIKGVFKGTPNTCTSCHSRGGAVIAQMKPGTHIPTAQDCAICHKTSGWIPALFSHVGLTESCSTCHNGTNQTGKPATHTQTTKDCGECHKTTAWVPAGIDHSTLVPPPDGRCADCHGRTATGKPSRHVFTTSQCDTCHKSQPVGFSWLPANFDHGIITPPVAGRCNDCHLSGAATKKTSTHIQSGTQQCDTCHTTAGWTPTSFSHALLSPPAANRCSDCHNGTLARGVTKKHIVVGSSQCDTCHATAGWVPTSFAHSVAQVGGKKCSDCHNGTQATGKSVGHISTKNYPLCDTCHSTVAWKPTQFVHENLTSASDCTTCHDGTHASGRPGGAKAHKNVPMTAKTCGSCHTIGKSWVPATMNHSGATKCSTCHGIGSAGNVWTPGKTNHISTQGHAQCADCHTTATWKPSSFNHQGVAKSGNCTVSCHNGVNATGRPTSGAKVHAVAPMTNTTCGSCHTVGTSWIPAKMNHTGVTACSSCHAYFGNSWTPAKPSHMGTSLQCSSCHTTNGWLPATFSHQGVTTASDCTQSGCHSTAGAVVPKAGRPVSGVKAHTTAPMTSNTCANCHTIGTVWAPATMNHTGATNCSTCHAYTGNSWTPTKSNHTTTTTQCSSCHATTNWLPATYTHEGVTSATTCSQSGCHDTAGKVAPKAGKPTTGAKAHTTAPMTSGTCAGCHNIGTVWAPATMNHTGATSCTSCHKISAAASAWTPAKANHISTTGHAQCSDCHTTTLWKPTSFAHGGGITSASDCYTGCHNGTAATGRPATGAKAHTKAPMTNKTCGSCHSIGSGWTPATMNHSGLTTCTGCHAISATGNNWTPGKTNHISTTNYPQCLSCHTTTAWLPTSFAHSGVTSASDCTTCHNGKSATGRPSAGARAHTVAPMTANTCGSCHTVGTAWVPATMNHTGLTSCTACHAYTGNGWTPAKATHISTTTQCSSCHATAAWLPATFSHQGVTAGTDCTQSGCHGTAGKAVPQAGRPAGHTTAPMTSNTCANCHTIGSSWTGWKMNHTGATACSTCHAYAGNSYTPAKANHLSTTTQCSSCHTTNGWLPATFSHQGVTTASDCTQSGCHSTAGAVVPKAGRPVSGVKAHTTAPMTSNTCATCHTIGTVWAPAKMNHTGATNCSSCHAISGNGFTPAKANHISTTGYSQCSSCHTTAAWLPTSFAHTGITSTANCTTCHNGASATGRPTAGARAHTVAPMTGSTCGSCHTVGTVWIPATMNHTGATSCNACHTYTGNAFTPARANHISTSSQCSNCHATIKWLPATFDHAANGVTSATNCTQSGCHDTANQATPRAGRPSTGAKAHVSIPMTNATCANCHTGYTSWTTVTMNHTGATSCSSCHAYNVANVWTLNSPKTGHISTATQCSACHASTVAWLPATNVHNGVTSATNCTQSGCHDTLNHAVPRAGRPSTGAKAHVTAPMTSNTCGNCHTIGTVWAPATMNHTGLTSCTSCHVYAGNGFTPAKTNHIAYSTTTYPQCSSCHLTTVWLPTSFKHTGMTAATNCTTCHNGTSAVGRPTTGAKAHTVAPMTGNACGSCHTIGTAWTPATMNHTGLTSCTSCHVTPAGNGFTPAKANHVSTSGYAQCSSCHTTTLWKPSTFAHQGVTTASNCTTCHNGTSATGTPVGAKAHTQAPMNTSTCGSCHAIGTVWVPGTMNHTGATTCTNCHATTGTAWNLAKPGHISTTGYPQCSSCHLTTAWLPTSFAHTGMTAATNCTTCHDGTHATGRPLTGAKPHTQPPLSTSTTCGSCHTIGTAWTPATMNHTGLTSCTSCHATAGNGFTPTKVNHIPTTGYAQCSSCHTTAAWLPTSFAHTGITGGCSICHNGVGATAPTASHAGISPSPYECNSCHKTTAWLPPTFAHSGVTSNCTNCHKAGFATVKSASHFITTQGCEKCHNTTAWAPMKAYVHTSSYYKTHTGLSMSIKADCLLCHIGNNEAISGAPHRGNATYKPDCAWCHSQQYKSGSHKKTQSPTTVFYTVAELKNCAGTCHEYTNNTFATVKITRTGQHRSTDGGF